MEQTTNFENQNLDQNLTPITHQKNIFKILFFILLALVLVISSVLITLLVTKNKTIAPVEELTTIPSPTAIPIQTIVDETADWKTYTNSTYKYSFNYPIDWILDNSALDSVTLETLEYQQKLNESSKTPGGLPRFCGYYSLMCFRNINEYSNFIYKKNSTVKTLSEFFLSDNLNFVNFNKLTINNFPAYEVTMGGMDTTKSYFISKNDSSFCEISFCDQKLTETESQFLNTFKFN